MLRGLKHIPLRVIREFLFDWGWQAIRACRNLDPPKEPYYDFISQCVVSFSTTFKTKNGKEEEHQNFYPVFKEVDSETRIIYLPRGWIIFEPYFDQLASHLYGDNGEPIEIGSSELKVQTAKGCALFG